MQAMVDFSVRMLSAIEDYSVRGSGHGQVALQSLRLRRSFATSHWCGKTDVLHQLKGIGATTIANLKFHGITKFEDVMNNTSDALDKAAHRAAPFGANLQGVVGTVLRCALKLSAKLEYAAGSSTPCTLVCELAPKYDKLSAHQTPSAATTSAVTYTILAFTDLPGGCLLFKNDISGHSVFKVDTPPKFGRVTIVIIASLAGLDGT
jgi:hypothetical protein